MSSRVITRCCPPSGAGPGDGPGRGTGERADADRGAGMRAGCGVQLGEDAEPADPGCRLAGGDADADDEPAAGDELAIADGDLTPDVHGRAGSDAWLERGHGQRRLR